MPLVLVQEKTGTCSDAYKRRKVSRYYVSFTGDFTGYTWIHIMKRKSDFLDIFKDFRAHIKTEHKTVIKCFRSDLGGE